MKYDFETLVDRTNQGSAKWKHAKEITINSQNVVPLSAADEDMVNPPQLIAGLKQYLDTMILGYTDLTPSYYDAVKSWFKRRHNWNIENDWLIYSPGVVSAIQNIVRAFTKEGDGVIIMSPAYYPFRSVINNTKRTLVENNLAYQEGVYTIDFDDLEQKMSEDNNKVFILCSPHNPIGRVWRLEELLRIVELAAKYHVLVVSDEIHMDIVMPGFKHHVYADLSDDAKNNCIICTAPSKSFNLAGLKTSNIIIPNEGIRTEFKAYLSTISGNSPNAIGPKACEIVYNECEEWFEQKLSLIDTNRILVEKFMSERLPQIKVIPLEGTYLQWLNFSSLSMSAEELYDFLVKDCGVVFSDGASFGENGKQFQRINISCPTAVLLENLEKIAQQLEK